MNRRGFLAKFVGGLAATVLFAKIELEEVKGKFLGINTTEEVGNYWSTNTRRKVFYEYPNGMSPLLGLLELWDKQT